MLHSGRCVVTFFVLNNFCAPVADEPVDQLPVDLDDVVVCRPMRRKLGRDPVQQREDHVAALLKMVNSYSTGLVTIHRRKW